MYNTHVYIKSNALKKWSQVAWSRHTAEENWIRFHNAQTATMKCNILQTNTDKRNNLPWITGAIKRIREV